MLELAPAAFRKVPAWRMLVMRAGQQRSVVLQHVAGDGERHVAAACRDAVAPRRDPDDGLAHSASASAAGMAAARSSAIIRGPAISAARP